jgi:2,3-bisphosphoglycerate-dependent phosphoglycerate mutase
MPRTIAALIRHGDYRQLPDTPSALQPFPLTDRGRQQAVKAGETLYKVATNNNWRFCSEVDSSQLLRGWQTAELIAGVLSKDALEPLTVTAYDELAERSVGSAANLTIQQIEAIIREDPRFEELPADWKSNSHFRLPLQGAESLMEAGQRVAAHLQKQMTSLAQEVKADTLKLFVGHGAAFRHAAHHLGVLEFEQIAQLSMYHAEPVFLEYRPGGEWRHVAGNWKVRSQHSEYSD